MSDENSDKGGQTKSDKGKGKKSAESNTIFNIKAHTGGPAPAPDTPPGWPDDEESGPSVTEELKKVRRGGDSDATMYEPTTADGRIGSNDATIIDDGSYTDAEITEARAAATSSNQQRGGTSHGSSTGGQPVAPFGGRIMVGTRVGQIEITGVLGKGGMGEVFRGFHHALDIGVALKVLPDELSRNELVRQRFLREARLCVKLDHKHIVRVFNVDEYAGNLYLVMEMIEGTDAAHMLKNGGRFRYRRALEIGLASADALAYAHTQGLVHRDVKPHNILLGAKDGKIKLSDFGLARAATSNSHLTMSGQIMGTPHYMSPEQAEAKEVTDKSDVYSLGVSLYHMLTGETPFIGDTPISVAVQHIAKEILFPKQRFDLFPKELTAVLKRMTAKDPAKRCSAKQAMVWLQKLLEIAHDDDIKQDTQAMQTLAPVVRESQAFKAAEQERQKHDNKAREAARTMLATIREEKAPTVEQKATAAPQPEPQPAKSGGAFKWVAMLMVALLVGGGAAWWFALGGEDFARDKGWIAAAPVAEPTDPDQPRDPAQPTGNGTDQPQQPTDPGQNGGTPDPIVVPVNGGNNNGSGTTPDPDPDPDPTTTTEPSAEESSIISGQLGAAESVISAASTVAELEPAMTRLERAANEIRAGRGTQGQRERYTDVRASYDRTYAILYTSEAIQEIESALAAFAAARGTDMQAAVGHLNRAIDRQEGLEKQAAPADVASQVRTRISDSRDRVDAAVEDLRVTLEGEIKRLIDQTLYEEADRLLSHLANVRLPHAELEAIMNRRHSVQTRDRHKRIRAQIRNEDFQRADATFRAAENAGVPEALEAEHAVVESELLGAIAAKFNGHMNTANEAVVAAEFALARTACDRAGELPLRTEQTVVLANKRAEIDLVERLHNADTALATNRFRDALENLEQAEELIRNPEVNFTDALRQRMRDTRSAYQSKLDETFNGYMAEAEAALEARNFVEVTSALTAANALPISPEQRSTIEAFKTANDETLTAYMQELIESIGKALDAGNFTSAQELLERAGNLPVPPEDAEHFNTLSERFAAEATRRHNDLLALARRALETRAYADVRDALANAAEIPVSTEEAETRSNLSKAWIERMTEEVDAHLDSARKLLDDGEFRDARTQIESAAAIGTYHEDLARRARVAQEQWDTRLQSTLDDLLSRAEEARAGQNFTLSASLLVEAKELPLGQDQLIRFSAAQDRHDSELAVHIDTKLDELEGCVNRGNEEQGQQIIEYLGQYNLSTEAHARLRELSGSLTGESSRDRYQRLPEHLKRYFDDVYIKVEQSIELGEIASAMHVTYDGQFGVVGAEGGRVTFYNLRRGTTIGTGIGGRRKVTAVAVSPDGSTAVSGNDSGDLVLFDLSGTTVQTHSLGNLRYEITGAAFTSNGRELYVLTRNDAQVTRFNPATRSRLDSFNTGVSDGYSLAISPDSRFIAVGGRRGALNVFDQSSRIRVQGGELSAPGRNNVTNVQFSADSSRLIAGSRGSSVGVWNTSNWTSDPVRTYEGLAADVHALTFSEDGRTAAGIDQSNRIVIWDAERGHERVRRELEQFGAPREDMTVTAAWFAPDGTGLFATRSGRILHIQIRSGP